MMKPIPIDSLKIDLVESVFPIVHYTKINPKLEDLRVFSIEF